MSESLHFTGSVFEVAFTMKSANKLILINGDIVKTMGTAIYLLDTGACVRRVHLSRILTG